MHFGPLEIGAILVIVLIIFGVGKLPQVGQALGKGIREFHKAKEGEDESKAEAEKPVVKAATTAEKKEG